MGAFPFHPLFLFLRFLASQSILIILSAFSGGLIFDPGEKERRRRDEEEVGVKGSIPGGPIVRLSDMLCNRYFPDSRMCRLVLPGKQSA